MSCNGVSLEACQALRDTQDVCKTYGTPIVIKMMNEGTVERDELGTIKSRDIDVRFNIHAFPVEVQPSVRSLEKAGLREAVECSVYTPMKSWIDAGYIKISNIGDDFAAIDITRSTVVLDGTEWKISDKGLSGRIGTAPMYVTFGLRRN